jgi:hypothetical protein
MPQTKRNAYTLRDRRRGSNRDQRLKVLAFDPLELQDDAPLGTYRIDSVAEELFALGAAFENNETEFVKQIRRDTGNAAQTSVISAREYLAGRPRKSHLTEGFFEDLHSIRSRIEQNKRLNHADFLISKVTRSGRPVRHRDVIEHLAWVLQLASYAIKIYTENYKPLSGKGGNYDWLTRTFIDGLVEFWCSYVRTERVGTKSRIFIRLIAAAWHDVGFPTMAEDGRCLEDWLADRVRKQFPKGFPRNFRFFKISKAMEHIESIP